MTDDWRLMGQEEFLIGREMRRTTWRSQQAGWDHDHCEFCSAETSDEKTGHSDYTEGWVTNDDSYSWVCVDCFEDFREQFRWTIAAP